MPEASIEPALFREQAFIGGRWIRSREGDMQTVEDPATLEIVGKVPMLESDAIADAIDIAQRAFGQWSQTAAVERADRLMAWYRAMHDNREALARLMTREQGKPIADARGEVTYAASFLRWFAEEGRRSLGVRIPSENPDSALGTVEEPIGIAAIITPWNFPLAMITRKAAAALAAGCSVIVKPAMETPFSALALAVLAEEAGLTNGEFNVVTGDSKSIASQLCAEPRVRALSFTGSTHVGQQLLKNSADTVKHMSMELGGNAPLIVCDDVDLEHAVDGALAAKFQTSGQDCLAANRIFVHRRIYDEFIKGFSERMNALVVGSGAEENTEIGPLIHTGAVEKAQAMVDDAQGKGAKVSGRSQDDAPGANFFMPTLVEGITPEMRLFREEVFAPVASVCVFDDDDSVIEAANDTEYGLAAYIFTNNDARIRKFLRRLDYGMVGINTMDITGPHVPFGGVKQSGLGREGGHVGLKEYLETKYYCIGGVPVH